MSRLYVTNALEAGVEGGVPALGKGIAVERAEGCLGNPTGRRQCAHHVGDWRDFIGRKHRGRSLELGRRQATRGLGQDPLRRSPFRGQPNKVVSQGIEHTCNGCRGEVLFTNERRHRAYVTEEGTDGGIVWKDDRRAAAVSGRAQRNCAYDVRLANNSAECCDRHASAQAHEGMMLLPREIGDGLQGLIGPNGKKDQIAALHDLRRGERYGNASGREARHAMAPWAHEQLGRIEAGRQEAAKHVGRNMSDSDDPDAHRFAFRSPARRAIGTNL